MNISSELNQSCEELRLFGKQELSNNADIALHYFVLGYDVVLFPLSLSLTGLIIFLIIKFKHLQQTTFFLALKVAIIDSLFVLTFLPVAIISAINGQWLFGLLTCNINGGIIVLFVQLRNWLMFVFVCDRFCTVFMPFSYNKHRKKVILILCLTVLALSVFAAGLPMILGCFGFSRVVWECIISIHETCPNYEFCQLHTITFIALGQIVGNVVPMVMYISLFIKAKIVRNRIIHPGAQIDVEQRKRDRKANLTFFTLFLALIGVSIPPLFGFFVLEFIFAPLGAQPSEVFLIVLSLLQELRTLLPVIDSIAILRNPDMRKAINILKNKLTNQRRGNIRTNATPRTAATTASSDVKSTAGTSTTTTSTTKTDTESSTVFDTTRTAAIYYTDATTSTENITPQIASVLGPGFPK